MEPRRVSLNHMEAVEMQWEALNWLRSRYLPQDEMEMCHFMSHGMEIDAFFQKCCQSYAEGMKREEKE